jgi:CHAT domain-containing protein
MEKLKLYASKTINADNSVSYYFEGKSRGGSAEELELGDRNVLEFKFEDETMWICDKNSLGNLFPEIENLDTDTFEIPDYIEYEEPGNRGFLKKIALKLLNVLIKKGVEEGVMELAKKLENKRLGTPIGLYKVSKKFELKPSYIVNVDKPYLLLLHGFNSSINGSFEDLKNSETWLNIQSKYGENIIGFQHETFSKSALENALELVKLLPNNIDLHIMSQSRGGLVGEILCRYAYHAGGILGFPDDSIEKLKEYERDEDLEIIRQLKLHFENNKIFVSKFLRISCPAAGTSLAGENLSTFLNTTLNLLGIATGIGSVAFDIFRELIMAALSNRDNPKVLPGVECMHPQSPFIEVLNSESPAHRLDIPLVVISGHRKIGLEFKALFAILSRIIFRRRNDFVVDTDSMYMGSKRTFEVQYYFIENTDINHFKYFNTLETQNAITNAINTVGNNPIPGFRKSFQTLVPSTDRADALGLEYGELKGDEVTGEKPIVILLPGIMGTNLKKGNKKIWIQYLNMIGGDLSEMQIGNDIVPDSLISTSYKKLKNHLSKTYDVVTFPYDWRIELEDSAKLLADKINDLLAIGQPIKVIAHSMGGVLFRDFVRTQKDTWKNLNDSEAFRIVFLGVPFNGSPRIPFVLMGQDGLINKLSTIDFMHSKKTLISYFVKFKGILNLLPTDSNSPSYQDFAKSDTWDKLRNSIEEITWPIPDHADLNYFNQYRTEVSAFDYSVFNNATYVAGKDKKTPYNYRYNEDGNLVLIYTNEGDASVTWDSIPAFFKLNDKLYFEPITHGELANEPDIFEKLDDLLIFGSTQKPPMDRSVNKSIQNLFVSKPDFDYDNSQRGLYASILGLNNFEKNEPPTVLIKVKVSNSDLFYSDFPVLAGHFQNDSILFAEKAIDDKLKGALSTRNQLGIHVGLIGQSDVLLPENSDFNGAIIVGLGKFASLTSTELSKTVEMGVCNYLIENHNKQQNKRKIGVSSLLIGCNYGGITVENSAMAIIEGVSNANNKIRNLIPEAVLVEEIEFIERYEDRALSCLYALSRRNTNLNNASSLFYLTSNKLNIKLGNKRRIAIEFSDEFWERITVSFDDDLKEYKGFKKLKFNISSGGARVEQKEVVINFSFLEQFIQSISTKNDWNVCDKKVIFESMIPHDFKDYLKKKKNIVWLVDKDTATYPWELLSDNSPDSKPLCINAGMIRQLSTSDFRLNSETISDKAALICADPPLNRFKGLSQLPGAKKEGQMVHEKLNEKSYKCTVKIEEPGVEMHKALYCGNYKIIHLAGHGIFNEESPLESGMVLGENHYLSALDISKMSTVPEFVFVNCCYLGQISTESEKLFQMRYKLAANVGTQLIENGVKAVIVAGWAVNDNAAYSFSEIFYEKMLNGYTFGEATRIAREKLFEEYLYTNNTWGAYQCYGDQFYKFDPKNNPEINTPSSYAISEEIEIELENLLNMLEVRDSSINEEIKAKDTSDKVEKIYGEAENSGLINAAIIEKVALIYAELNNYEKAIEVYSKLLKKEKADFSVSALEKYSNLRIKALVRTNSSKGVSDVKSIYDIIAGLKSLLQISETSERFCLIGSAFKRLAFVVTPSQKLKYYKDAAFNYFQGYKILQNSQNEYPIFNCLIIVELIGSFSFFDTKTKNVLENEFSLKFDQLKTEFLDKIDFRINESLSINDYGKYRSMITEGNMRLTKLILSENAYTQQEEWKNLKNAYLKTWNKVGTPSKIASTFENFEIISDIIDLGLALQNSSKSTDKIFIDKLENLKLNMKILRNLKN